MKTNSFLKIMVAASNIAYKTTGGILGKTRDIIEDRVLKGNYVTREEFEKVQILVIKLQKELEKIKSDHKIK
jgi:BMFP domain-containing protein YqiC